MTVIRHRKENRNKCTLTPFEKDPRFSFLTYPDTKQPLPDWSPHLLLRVEAPPLSKDDPDLPLLLIDATWRYADHILSKLPPVFIARSLPNGWQTAYPRRQDQAGGLASIEALFAASCVRGNPMWDLLDFYYWKESFLAKNQALILDWS